MCLLHGSELALRVVIFKLSWRQLTIWWREGADIEHRNSPNSQLIPWSHRRFKALRMSTMSKAHCNGLQPKSYGLQPTSKTSRFKALRISILLRRARLFAFAHFVLSHAQPRLCNCSAFYKFASQANSSPKETEETRREQSI